MNKIKLAVFHYHFLPGGITTVIKLSLISLIRYNPSIREIALISGRYDNAEKLKSDIQSSVPEADVKISIEIIPELDYLGEELNPGKDYILSLEKLLLKYRGFIYWVHNHHIGKNPVFTKTVTEFAEKEHGERFFFHIHDFPECSRYSNYKFLNKYVSNPYPAAENIKYAVLNSRDYNLMINAGFDTDSLFLLPNPVIQNKSAEEKISKEEKRKIKETLYLKTKGIFNFDPAKPVFLYPVRAIRRKNIIEAAMIALLTGDGGNLIQTLPGISDQEIKYSSFISDLYSKKYIKGLWGTGISGSAADSDLKSVISITDAVISSSVMEGFGYIFTDTVMWGKPIISRYLETSEDFMKMFSENSSYFYDTFKIPQAEKLKKDLIEQINGYFTTLDKEYRDIINPEEYIHYISSGKTLDFSYLPYDIQGEYLKQLKIDNDLKLEIKSINSQLLTNAEELLQGDTAVEDIDINSLYGPEIFADNFGGILDSYEKTTMKSEKSENISEKLLSLFTTKNSVRLINGTG